MKRAHIYRRPERDNRVIVPLVDVDTILKHMGVGDIEVPEQIKHSLEMGRLFPDITNMKTTFEAPEANPNLVNLAAVTGGTAEVNLWNPVQWTPLPAGPGSNNYVTPGQVWELQAFGICTYAATPGTTAFTARTGTSATPASNVLLGAASAAVTGTTASGVNWFLNGNWYCRAVGLPGANSTVYGKFVFTCPLAIQSAGAAGGIIFGGQSTVTDVSIANGVALSVTPSVTTQSFTPEMISWRSIG